MNEINLEEEKNDPKLDKNIAKQKKEELLKNIKTFKFIEVIIACLLTENSRNFIPPIFLSLNIFTNQLYHSHQKFSLRIILQTSRNHNSSCPPPQICEHNKFLRHSSAH